MAGFHQSNPIPSPFNQRQDTKPRTGLDGKRLVAYRRIHLLAGEEDGGDKTFQRRNHSFLVLLSSQFVGIIAVVAVFCSEDSYVLGTPKAKGKARKEQEKKEKKRKEEERLPSSDPSLNERDAPKGEARETRPHREKGRKAGAGAAGAAERPTGPKKEFAPMQIKKEGLSP